MKRIVIILMAVMLICCGMHSVKAEKDQIDGNALAWYAQTVTSVFSTTTIPISMAVDELEGYWTLLTNYDAEKERSATIEEILVSDEPSVDLTLLYDAYNSSIAFVFERKTVDEIPQAVEIYADGNRLTGELNVSPDKVNDETRFIGFWFTVDEIEKTIYAENAFMRLVTDRGTYFIEMNMDDMFITYCMMLLICDGVRYADTDSPYYLDKSELLDVIQEWQSANETAPQQSMNYQPLTFQMDYEAIDKAAKSAFLLEVYDINDRLLCTGSGFVAFDKSTMITNEHVIEGGAYVIAHSDQYSASYKLTEIKAVDSEADIAILKFDANANIQPLKVDSEAKLLRGQPVTTIGSPKGVLNTVSSGNISNIVYYSEKIPDYIQFTAPISPGSSGGALFNEYGKVIGLCVSYLKEGQAMYYAIPIKYVEELYESAKKQETVSLTMYNNLLVNAPVLQLDGDGIRVKWNEVPKVNQYFIYRRRVSNGTTFQHMKTVADAEYLDTAVRSGTEYEYRIGFFVNGSLMLSETACITYQEQGFAAPKLTIVSDGIKLTWNPVEGARGYLVYRRLAGDNNAEFQQVYYVLTAECLDKNVKPGFKYEYRIGVQENNKTTNSKISRIEYPLKATAKPTIMPTTVKINYNVMANKGVYTISWAGGSSASNTYRISYSLSSGAGKTYTASGIRGNFYTTSWLIPGREYKVTLTNSNGVSVSGTIKVPSASVFKDGNITASKVGIQVSPRRDADGPQGPAGPVYEKTLVAADMTANMIKKNWSYGLYYRIDLPSFSGTRIYRETIVFRAPNGYSDIWNSGSYEYTYLGSDGWWKWDIMGEEFFQALIDKYRKIPSGQYYVDLYWNGMLVNTKPFQVK